MILETILALSAVDYDHLARAVQVEAAPNTRDEFCVAVSILNRVRSPHYPNTVADVVYAPGQYEGFLYWNPSAKQDVVDPSELLPRDNNSEFAKLNPAGSGDLKNVNLLKSGHHIGINTVGQSLRNANLQLRSDPTIERRNVGPWNNSSE